MHASNVILLAKLTDTFRLHKHIELNYKWKQFIPDQNSVKSKPTKANLDRDKKTTFIRTALNISFSEFDKCTIFYSHKMDSNEIK